MRQLLLSPGEDGYWLTECPSLPGCINQGQIREQAVADARNPSAFAGIARNSNLLLFPSMHVITHSRIVEAQTRFPGCATALDWWYRAMKRGRFENFAGLRAAFGSVDKVGPLYVFDVGGNKLRLVAAVHFNTGRVFIRNVLTHAEYDGEQWKRKEGLQ
jgi:mRNA interferase HigB